MDNEFSKVLSVDTKNWWVDRMYLQDAVHAARHSTDPSTQVGAVLVVPTGTGVILKNWNRVPNRLKQSGYPLNISDKNHCTEHAERSVVYDALQKGIPTTGLTMYCTWASCSECSRAIISFGVTRVVTFTRLVERTPERWKTSIFQGLRMMRDCGISVVGWHGDIGTNVCLRFDGEYITEKTLE